MSIFRVRTRLGPDLEGRGRQGRETTMTKAPSTSTTALARAAAVAAVLAGTALLGTAAAYATVDDATPEPPATTRVEPAHHRATDGLEPVQLQRVYRVPFAQLASTGGR
jgi:hypothetical protein